MRLDHAAREGCTHPALLDRLSRLKSDRRWSRRRLLILGGEGSERSREAETREPQRPRFSVERPEHSIGSHGRDWRSLPPGAFCEISSLLDKPPDNPSQKAATQKGKRRHADCDNKECQQALVIEANK